MAEGIAKSAPVSSAPSTPTFTKGETLGGTLAWEGVPVDVIRMFNVEIGTVHQKDIEKLKDICSWADSKCEEKTIGNIMQKISTLERQLGSPALSEKRWDKIWNWVKISKQIDDLDKRRESLRGMVWR